MDKTFGSSCEILKQVKSPDGKLKAIILTCDCGVPCEVENDVAVLRADDSRTEGFPYVFDTYSGDGQKFSDSTPRSATHYPLWVGVTWLDNRQLAVTFNRRAKVNTSRISFSVLTHFWEKDEAVGVKYIPVDDFTAAVESRLKMTDKPMSNRIGQP